jgi:uncharacterized protein
MFKIAFADLVATPWKNGGGITREIVAQREGQDIIFRISLADVETDGAFSRFDGLHRILTVLEGRGMVLKAPHATLHADKGVPLHFDGAWDIHATLKDGPLRDLNVIYDPRRCAAQVEVVADSNTVQAKPNQLKFIHCYKGTALLNSTTLEKGDTAILDPASPAHELHMQGEALLITIYGVSQAAASSAFTALR